MKTDMANRAMMAVGAILQDAGVCHEPVKNLPGHGCMDAAFRLHPGGKTLWVQYHPSLAPYQVGAALAFAREQAGPKGHTGLCVRRMSWALLDACKAADAALFDLEGNAYLRLPGLYIERIRPSRESSPEPTSGTVFTAKAARLVRALLKQYPEGWTQAELIRATGLSAGYVSTLAKRLAGQGYVSDRLGRLFPEEPDRLLNDWVAHYRFDRHRKLSYAVSAANYDAGLKKLGNALDASTTRFSWTGWTGAHLRAAHATPTQYTAYVADTPKTMKGVFPVEGQGNVTLYVPHDEGVFQFTTPSVNGEIVSDAQLYADLYRMPGRAKEQADALRHHCLDYAGRKA